MALKKKPVTGMKDILPKEMAIREYVQAQIRETYKSFGFSSIETPCVEHIENLSSKQGGENEKLIFKILKRGEKLKIDEAKSQEDLVDGGLRYDLTLPLSRYFSNNSSVLSQPFKALQMGNVWRADRPQRGRFRQFMQCDIDILGEASVLAEIDLILAMTTLLGKLGFKNYSIRINDRRMLKAMASYSGFSADIFDTVFIILDKMDKIGLEGVRKELLEEGIEEEKIDKYLALYEEVTNDLSGISYLKGKLGDFLSQEVSTGLETIISSVLDAGNENFNIIFDPTLVRGMSYYTGPIFEISMDEFGGSVGGGGRYDEMIGKFTGMDIPACGFSVGFERIVMLLMESGFEVPDEGEKIAYLADKKLSKDELLEVLKLASKERANGKCISVVTMNKNKKFQKQQLSEAGYTEFKEFFPQ
ncbi:histidyl-tRNA synthetase [Acetitomaculum ruminis DSM 5522]|uniref:Histidine--tRNA ligase n=1 Tax=Acetitomaculum ruminis DSM 5522 TaxID=1120918 RepID=A0A1I1AFG9_9FIRM|nr:histidine--tRNA ligase [Acetitomaculum ruminis]SFB36106.1 histidyl-tRNA synthetase [Acetitomaculum ruminis DSM 5522]